MHDHAESLGSTVRARRRELGLRQDELAALAEVSTRFVHAVEHDKRTIRLDALLAVLNTLGLNLIVAGPQNSSVVQFHPSEATERGTRS